MVARKTHSVDSVRAIALGADKCDVLIIIGRQRKQWNTVTSGNIVSIGNRVA